jgi:hypothetical protein
VTTSISVWIDELIERSSFGTPVARALRHRTGDDEVALVQRLLARLEPSDDSTREIRPDVHTASDENHRSDRSPA